MIHLAKSSYSHGVLVCAAIEIYFDNTLVTASSVNDNLSCIMRSKKTADILTQMCPTFQKRGEEIRAGRRGEGFAQICTNNCNEVKRENVDVKITMKKRNSERFITR